MSGVSCQELSPLRYPASRSWGHLVKLLKTREYEAGGTAMGKGASRNRGALKSAMLLDDRAELTRVGRLVLEGREQDAAWELLKAKLMPACGAVVNVMRSGSVATGDLLPVARQLWPYCHNDVNIRKNMANLLSVFVAVGLLERTNNMGRGGSMWRLKK